MCPTSETITRPSCILPVGRVIERLLESPSVCDQRKSGDLQTLKELAEGPWSGRLVLLGVDCGRQRSMDVVVQLDVPGLVWRGRPEPHRNWTMILAVPHNYPLALPDVRFAGPAVPYCSHVIHREFLPDENGLPPELRQFVEAVRAGRDGACCYLRHSQWSPLTTHNLAMVVWQVSRILSGTRLFGERGSLNRHANDHYQQLKDTDKLPLGPALPVPFSDLVDGQPNYSEEDAGGEEEEAIEWTSEP